jgi:hypothetical protein
VNLITLHHSLYYCPETQWPALFRHLYRYVLAPRGVIHAVLMASRCANPGTTTWLYNHFAGRYCGHQNDQDLLRFRRRLIQDPLYRKARVLSHTSQVRFFVDDFADYMAVVWMLLLYPQVHRFTRPQRAAITEHVYRQFWRLRRPLLQIQHHLLVYRGLPGIP